MDPDGHHVVLFSRPRCGLCDQAREVIITTRAEVAFSFDEVDITDDERLERAYGIRVPVVLIDGDEVFEVEVDPAGFAAMVVAPTASHADG